MQQNYHLIEFLILAKLWHILEGLLCVVKTWTETEDLKYDLFYIPLIKGALDNFSLIPHFCPKSLDFHTIRNVYLWLHA